MTPQTNVAERIRDEREWCGFTRDQVAQKLRLPWHTIEAFEIGTQEPTSEQVAALAALFGLTPERLQGEPLAEEPTMAVLCGSRDLTAEDRYQVMRFAEYLRHSGPPPAITRTDNR